MRIKETVNVGDKVCVHTTLNQVMYCRALVLDRTENECNVLNVDYGNKETVCLNDIFELPEEFEKVCLIYVYYMYILLKEFCLSC